MPYSAIKNLAKKVVYKAPKSVTDAIYTIYYRICYMDQCESRKSYGEKNPDITFYVIRPRKNSVEGLMALFLYVIQMIDYAEAKGYVPIVDFKNYKTQYAKEDGINTWEVFFNQINTIALDEVYQSKNVILSGVEATLKSNKAFANKSFDTKDLKLAHEYISKYIKIAPNVKKLLVEESNKIIPEKCIGLYLRGTDYIKLRPAGEFIQPNVSEVIEYVLNIREKSNLDRIYLVTEDYEIYREVKDTFGESLIVVSYDNYIKNYRSKKFLAQDSSLDEIDLDPYIRGIQYLVKILLLSKCKYIVGGKTCGSWAACAFSDNRKNLHLFDLGRY